MLPYYELKTNKINTHLQCLFLSLLSLIIIFVDISFKVNTFFPVFSRIQISKRIHERRRKKVRYLNYYYVMNILLLCRPNESQKNTADTVQSNLKTFSSLLKEDCLKIESSKGWVTAIYFLFRIRATNNRPNK